MQDVPFRGSWGGVFTGAARRLGGAWLALALLVPSVASAQDQVPSQPAGPAAGPPPATAPPAPSPGGQSVVEQQGDDSRFRIEGQLGIAMPLGGAGLEITSQIATGISISGGVGKSIHGPVQVAVMPRLNVIRLFGSIHLSVGAGVSYGDYEQTDFLLTGGGFYPSTLWGNLELSLLVTLGGVGVRAFSGFSQMLSHGTDPDRSEPSATELPYLGLGVSYTM